MRTIRSHVEGRCDRARERRYQKRYAKRHHYFWLDCPVCGDFFGGHEAHGYIPQPGELGLGVSICPACTAERQNVTERLLLEHGEGWAMTTTRWGFQPYIRHTPDGGALTRTVG